eukprot:3659827-Alexandrium_andersonii.AAC.1
MSSRLPRLPDCLAFSLFHSPGSAPGHRGPGGARRRCRVHGLHWPRVHAVGTSRRGHDLET